MASSPSLLWSSLFGYWLHLGLSFWPDNQMAWLGPTYAERPEYSPGLTLTQT